MQLLDTRCLLYSKRSIISQGSSDGIAINRGRGSIHRLSAWIWLQVKVWSQTCCYTWSILSAFPMMINNAWGVFNHIIHIVPFAPWKRFMISSTKNNDRSKNYSKHLSTSSTSKKRCHRQLWYYHLHHIEVGNLLDQSALKKGPERHIIHMILYLKRFLVEKKLANSFQCHFASHPSPRERMHIV